MILSARKGAKTGSFVVKVDASVLHQLAELGAPSGASAPAARTNGIRPSHAPRPSRPESQLTPREMQDLLRGGWTLEEVAVEAGVDVDWVSRFASPVLAEMHLILEQARGLIFTKPRVGPSALALAPSVRRNVAERGVRFTDEDFDSAWRAYQVDDVTWIIAFDYVSRGRTQTAEWLLDLDEDELISHNRLGTQLGYVQSARRRVDTTPPPKPKPKAAAKRAVRAPAEPAAAPKVVEPAARPRAARPAPAKKKAAAATKKKKPAKPRAEVSTRSGEDRQVDDRAIAPRTDPYRAELERRLAAEAAARAQRERAREPAPAPSPTPPPARELARDLEPVAIIGPTVRTLARRRPVPASPAPPAPQAAPDPVPSRAEEPAPSRPRRQLVPAHTPVPEVEVEHDDLPDFQWQPQSGRHGPLPRPEPVPVPEEVKARATATLGTAEGDDDVDASRWFPPPRVPAAPTFKGAQTAGDTAPTSAAAAPRRRRSEPLRGR